MRNRDLHPYNHFQPKSSNLDVYKDGRLGVISQTLVAIFDVLDYLTIILSQNGTSGAIFSEPSNAK